MHLTLVINSLGIGGAERVLVRLAHAWADRGHKVSFITFFQEKNLSYDLEQKNGKISLINLGEDKPLQNQNGIEYFFRIVKRIYLLRKLFKELRPDLIISFLVGVNITVLLANLFSKIPVLISERIDPSKHEIPEFYKKLRLLTYRWAAAIVVQTKGVANYFPQKYQQQILIIPNFVKQSSVKKKINAPEDCKDQKINNIITVGRLHNQKDHQTLIYAFAKLADSYPNITLTIYGDGELRDFLQQLITDLKLQNRIFLPGIAIDIEKTLVAADLFVFPSMYEGFPNALCEAMSCGLPVIASDCAGNIDIIQDGENGLLFRSGNIDELTLLMKRLLNSPEQCNKLARNAQNVIHKFNELEILKLWDDALILAKTKP